MQLYKVSLRIRCYSLQKIVRSRITMKKKNNELEKIEIVTKSVPTLSKQVEQLTKENEELKKRLGMTNLPSEQKNCGKRLKQKAGDLPYFIVNQLAVAGVWLTLALLGLGLASIQYSCMLVGIIPWLSLSLLSCCCKPLVKPNNLRSLLGTILTEIVCWQTSYDVTNKIFGYDTSSKQKPYLLVRDLLVGLFTAGLSSAIGFVYLLMTLGGKNIEKTSNHNKLNHSLSSNSKPKSNCTPAKAVIEVVDFISKFATQFIAAFSWALFWEVKVPPFNGQKDTFLEKLPQALWQGFINFLVTVIFVGSINIAAYFIKDKIAHSTCKKRNSPKLFKELPDDNERPNRENYTPIKNEKESSVVPNNGSIN